MDIQPNQTRSRPPVHPASKRPPGARGIVTVERVGARAPVRGAELLSAFNAIDGISSARIVQEFMDRTTVSFEWADGSPRLDRIDRTLDGLGIRRIR